MKRFLDDKYKATVNKRDFFLNRGCRYRVYEGEGVYIFTFPLDKWKNYTVMEGRILIYESDGEVRIDVYTHEGYSFAQFYNPTNEAYEEYLNRIYTKIENTFKYLKIKKLNKRGRRSKIA